MDTLNTAAPSHLPAKRPRGRPRKTADERDDGNRRLALLSAAAKLFRTQGFAATSTRDIAAAVGMHSGSPFYHFDSKGSMLFAVMEEGMRAAMARQAKALSDVLLNKELPTHMEQALLAVLVRNHLDVLLGPDADFVPVMLYEFRSLDAAQQAQIKRVMSEYEAAWLPVLQALRDAGQLRVEVKLARLMIFGALNWTTQWYDPLHPAAASLDEVAASAIALFLNPALEPHA